MKIQLFNSKYNVILKPKHSFPKKDILGYIDWADKEIFIDPRSKQEAPLGIRQVLLHEIFHDFVRQYGGIHREDTIDGIAKGLAMNLNYGFIRKLYKLEREIEAQIGKNADSP